MAPSSLYVEGVPSSVGLWKGTHWVPGWEGGRREQGGGLEWGQWVDHSLALALDILLCQALVFLKTDNTL